MANADMTRTTVHAMRLISCLPLLIVFVLVPRLCVAVDDQLGRLFTSPAERNVLNELREKNIVRDDSAPKSLQAIQEDQKHKKFVIVNGVVKRGDHDKIIWIDGKPVENKKISGNIRIVRGPDQDGRISVAVSGKRTVRLKPGQGLQLDNGRIVENYLLATKVDDAVSP